MCRRCCCACSSWITVFGNNLANIFSPFGSSSPGPVGLVCKLFYRQRAWSLTIGNLLQGALINAVAQSYLGQPITSIAAYRFGLRRYLMLVPASILPLIIGSIGGIIPGVLGLILGFTGMSRFFLSRSMPRSNQTSAPGRSSCSA